MLHNDDDDDSNKHLFETNLPSYPYYLLNDDDD